VVESLGEKNLGTCCFAGRSKSFNNEVLVPTGQQITEINMKAIDASPIEKVEVRSPLVCEALKGICAKCYGRNLATGKMTQRGEAVGVIAANLLVSGTQLHYVLHVGGSCGGISEESSIITKFKGKLEIEDIKLLKEKTTTVLLIC
jgi:DNA-directed RNA polymerase subunit beta'